MAKKSKKKKIREIQLPMRFNPGLSKYEPELPTRKAKSKIREVEVVKTKRNWWAFWYIVISLLIFIIEGLYLLTRYFRK
jgi:hypothetical protein